jgi:hypothetical protein
LHFRASEYGRDKLAHLIGWGTERRLGRRALRLLTVAAKTRYEFGAANQVHGIDAQNPADDTEQEQSAKSDTAASADGQPPRPIPAPIFYPVAAWEIIETHSN